MPRPRKYDTVITRLAILAVVNTGEAAEETDHILWTLRQVLTNERVEEIITRAAELVEA